MFDRECKEVFYQRYRNRVRWEMIAQLHYVDERTPRRWRDAEKNANKPSYNARFRWLNRNNLLDLNVMKSTW